MHGSHRSVGRIDYETAIAVYRRIAERSEVVRIDAPWDAVVWVRADHGHLYKREDPGGGLLGSETQISFRSLAQYLGCGEAYVIVSDEQLPATAEEIQTG